MTDETHVDDMEAAAAAQPLEGRGGEQPKLYFEQERGLNSIIASAEIAAAYYGVTKQTLSNWVRKGCPRHRYGYYDIKAVSEWRLRDSGIGVAPEEERDVEKMNISDQKRYYESKLKSEQAETARFKNALLQGDYLERTQVVDQLKSFALVLKRSLQGLGKKLSREVAAYVDPQEARRLDQLITDTVGDALEQMSIDGVYVYDEP